MAQHDDQRGQWPVVPAPGRRGRWPFWAVWAAPVGAALLLSSVVLLRDRLFPLELVPKGNTVSHTVRATHDAVYDLHETYVAEVEEARQSYVPIYHKDNQLIWDQRTRILEAALKQPLKSWGWPPVTEPEPPRPPPPDARPAAAPDARRGKAGPRPPRQPDLGPMDSGPDASYAQLKEAWEAQKLAVERTREDRRNELRSLVKGFFGILVPFYKTGVVDDSEFPKEKETIRIFARGSYHTRAVSTLTRFSALRGELLKRGAQYFFKTDAKVRERVVDFILQRLPPNMTYAPENEKFTDISQVTGVQMVLIRRGEVLVRPGQVVDTRAYYAIKASVVAAAATPWWGGSVAHTALLLAVMLLFVVLCREVCQGSRPPHQLIFYAWLTLLAAGGAALMLALPVNAAAVPGAAVALSLSVVLGRHQGLLAALVTPLALVLVLVFDLSTLLVGLAGGVAGALAVRRRRRGSVVAAGVLVGLVQALAFEACRAAEGRPRTYAELWAAGEAFGGGLAAGVLALLALPFVERAAGRASRGKLKVLTDFDHPLVRELRERAPGTFAHTVHLVNMVEMAVEAVGGDRLLARAGTLFHDLGKMENPRYFVENQGLGPNVHDTLSPEESARAIVAHVEDGLVLARRHRLPPDVAAFIPEHHGTTGLSYFIHKVRESGGEPDPRLFRYPGPKPQSIETAILMIADSVEAASRTLPEPSEEALAELVDRIVAGKFDQGQFEECGITQGQLSAVKRALVTYLRGALHRRVAYPKDDDDNGGP